MYFCAIHRASMPRPTPISRTRSSRAVNWMPRPRLFPAGFNIQMFCTPSRPNCGSIALSFGTTSLAATKRASSSAHLEGPAAPSAVPAAPRSPSTAPSPPSSLSLGSEPSASSATSCLHSCCGSTEAAAHAPVCPTCPFQGFKDRPGFFSEHSARALHSSSPMSGDGGSSKASSMLRHLLWQTANATATAERRKPALAPPSAVRPPSATKRRNMQAHVVNLKSSTNASTCGVEVKS
mmetsp:Transcript_66076/g.184015  ORF Transcript_66076/g.184015 Transcript_66076/m.184015 type:complete len:236 (+) Transcript_66076:876-1583(+)